MVFCNMDNNLFEVVVFKVTILILIDGFLQSLEGGITMGNQLRSQSLF